MNLQQTVTNSVRAFLEGKPKQVVVAYSGGVDSHLMLATVAELATEYPANQYLAVHVNHGLSPNADKWQQHCQKVCEEYRFPLKIQQVKVQASGNGGVEAAARKVRYQAIESVTQHKGVILLAQHVQDQLETVLLQLKRGAGPKGLSAMGQTLEKENGIILARPFLQIEKQHILQLAKHKNLQWIEDESNQDSRFDRNFLRTQIVPSLIARWPNLAEAAHRTAKLCAEQQRLLDEVNEQHLQGMINQRFAIDIPKLLSLSQAWQNQIVRYWLAQQQLTMPSYSVLDELPKLFHAKQDANPSIEIDDYQLRRFRDHLYCVRKKNVEVFSERKLIARNTILPNFLGQLRIADNLIGELTIKSRDNSLTFKPKAARHSKPLKQWFKEWNVPVWERERSLVVYLHEQVIAIVCDQQIFFADNVSDDVASSIHFEASPPKL
ncbi:tRNA lysidine(34) synthetase TilS [Aliiglaciecola lipolytica]|uniref:tRNA(Ile)-lysidine synthase n=1 Tax=Aliiglaciecola lipolytica E3 TaxID=1127673 RepID=K6YCM6_9ALTE|nr:tRNA lysidine(34) synthetase TilS [Aliiglaciecola lipolytica]GAC14373.1 tRNA(Ile)-lysidine synthase [Aliiglaciecola lipolytica E3]